MYNHIVIILSDHIIGPLDNVEEKSWKPAQGEHQNDHKQHLVNRFNVEPILTIESDDHVQYYPFSH